jgi:membrane-bound ClpP family serine protease
MFGGNYSRTTFWIVSLVTFFIGGFILVFIQAIEASSGDDSIGTVFAFLIGLMLINTLANRIRDYGSNPWLSLWALIPLVGMFQAFYYGIRYKKPKESLNNSTSGNYSNSASEESVLKSFEYEHDVKQSTQQTTHDASRPIKRLE